MIVKKDKIDRGEFFRRIGTYVAAGSIVAVSGFVVRRFTQQTSGSEFMWQIDHTKCTHCGKCETSCVLKTSAVKCFHSNTVCGYCDLCGGYYRQNVKTLNTAAENLMCPTGAIQRRFVEEPYFEYTVKEELCNGCGKCAKGCNSFGNGSLYLQINQHLCVKCNDCEIARICPSGAIRRVPTDTAYNLKGE